MGDFPATKIKIEEDDDLHCIETIFIQVKEEALDYEDEGEQSSAGVFPEEEDDDDESMTKCAVREEPPTILTEGSGFSKQDIFCSQTTVRMLRFYLDLYKNGAPDRTRFTCHICYCSFAAKENLNQHLVTHSVVKPFTCDTCKRSFTQLSAFNDHTWMKKHRNCNKYYAPSKDIKYHCEVCNIDFVRQYQFHEHIRTHTGYKPFRCDLCNKSYKLSAQLKKHALVHL